MTKQIRAGIVALLLSLSAGAAENVGMLTELHGAVQLASAETADWTSATLMKAVSVGDKLRTPAGATVTVVFFANGKREQLQAGCLAVVQTAGCKVETGPQPKQLTPVRTSRAKRLSGITVGNSLGGGVLNRGFGGKLKPQALFDTCILATRPTFCWQVEDATESGEAVSRYVLLLYDAEDRLLWAQAAAGTGRR